MASYHLSVKAISRSAGRSATAAAAYRSGSAIACEREGRIHDYVRRSGVAHSEIVLPDKAPKLDRAELWNAAEAAERRKNSTVAREFEIALPLELSAAERQRLALALAREITQRHGCAVDVAIHLPANGDKRNHHAHLLTTTRRLGPDGLGEKCRELDSQISGPKEVEYWRERWATLQNQALEKAGESIRVTHLARTHEQVLAGFEPTAHLGPDSSTLERRGIRTEIGDLNRAIIYRNNERKALRQLIAESEGQIRLEPKAAEQKAPTPIQQTPPSAAQPQGPRTPAEEAAMFDRLIQVEAAVRAQRLAAIQVKAKAREDRRIDALNSRVAQEPKAPAGLMGAFKQKGYEQAHEQWHQEASALEKLAAQGRALRVRITQAIEQVQQWAEAQLRAKYPAAAKRIDEYKADQRQVQRHAAQERHERERMAKSLAAEARTVVENWQQRGQRPGPEVPPTVIEAGRRYIAYRQQNGAPQAEHLTVKNLCEEAAGKPQGARQASPGVQAPKPSQSLLERHAEQVRSRPLEPQQRPQPDQDIER